MDVGIDLRGFLASSPKAQKNVRQKQAQMILHKIYCDNQVCPSHKKGWTWLSRRYTGTENNKSAVPNSESSHVTQSAFRKKEILPTLSWHTVLSISLGMCIVSY